MSNKIKSARYTKMKSGQFLSSYTPYGYRKSQDDKHKLIIDEYAAAVVRRAFSMRRDVHGESPQRCFLQSTV